MNLPLFTLDDYETIFADRHLLHCVVAKWAKARPDAPAILSAEGDRAVTWSGFGQRRAAEVVCLIENRQREEEDQRGNHNSKQVTEPHLGGSAAKNVPHLEILQHLPRHSRRDARPPAAMPSTAVTPPAPETPIATISRAATTNVQSVSPANRLVPGR